MTRRRVPTLLAAIASVAMAMTACGDAPPPSAPTPSPAPPASPAPVPVRIQVEGPPGLSSIGQTAQLHAFAVFSDGSRRDVTGETGWLSFGESIVTVSSTGLATATGFGEVDIRAEHRGLFAGIRLPVSRAFGPLFRLTGVIRDLDTGAAVPGAMVERLAARPLDGATALSDHTGAFDVGEAAGVVSLRLSRFGYAGRFTTIPDMAAPTRLDLAMQAEPRPFVERSFEDRFEGTGSLRTRSYRIVTRAQGLLDVLVEATPCAGTSVMQVELRSGGSFFGGGTCAGRVKVYVPESECWLVILSDAPGAFRVTYREPG